MNRKTYSNLKALKIYIIAVLLLLISCENQENLIEKHFINQDEKLLDELVINFKKSICPKEYTEDCLINYLEAIRDSFNSNYSIETKLSGSELENILNKYVDTTSSRIFIKQCGIRNLEKNYEIHYYCINPNGKYMTFLQDLGKRSDIIADYSKSLYQIGDIGPNSTARVINDFEKFNFRNEENLVLLVIHYVQKEIEWNAGEKLKNKE